MMAGRSGLPFYTQQVCAHGQTFDHLMKLIRDSYRLDASTTTNASFWRVLRFEGRMTFMLAEGGHASQFWPLG